MSEDHIERGAGEGQRKEVGHLESNVRNPCSSARARARST
jgi:hypothetical protein